MRSQLKLLLAEPFCLQGLSLSLAKLRSNLNIPLNYASQAEKGSAWPGMETYLHSESFLIKEVFQKAPVL